MATTEILQPREAAGGKVTLVTGAASGIGRATAMLFARRGMAVSLVDLDEGGGHAVEEAIRHAGGRARVIAADVSSADDCRSVVEVTIEVFGRLDVLVNNAGIIRRATVLDTTEEEWDRVMAVNVKSIFLLSKYAVPAIAGGGGGAIINVSSGWGLKGGPRAAAYCASKGAVVQLTRAMAIDHAAQNIRVNCICPGDTDTAMLRHEARQLGEPEDRFLAVAAARPLGRIGRPEDIADAAWFLASDESAFVTGTTLVVDGGGLA
jgi:NAD(P)-dependent dehydrogenase (short-subunit alcohol dehydrogenase family)